MEEFICLELINAVKINNDNKKILEQDIDNEFKNALSGIKKLPSGVRLGVYSAYLYYLILFKKIKRLDVDELLRKRVRISNWTKTCFALKISY